MQISLDMLSPSKYTGIMETKTIIAKHNSGLRTTHNGDGMFTRAWRLLADGTVERTNSKSKYQPWIDGEQIPPCLLDAATENNIHIRPGRPAKIKIRGLRG